MLKCHIDELPSKGGLPCTSVSMEHMRAQLTSKFSDEALRTQQCIQTTQNTNVWFLCEIAAYTGKLHTPKEEQQLLILL